MHLHIGFAELIVFALYYLIVKAVMQLVNIEARRNGLTVVAGVSGLFA
jgi:hypothetical protein